MKLDYLYYMNQNLKNKIIEEYLSGKGSTIISRELKIYKQAVLKAIRDAGLTRKRDRCKSLEIIKEGDYFVINRICPICQKKIKTKSKNKTIACRNHFRKINGTSICKKCSLKLQIGEKNPFFGKKHTKETLEKISKTLMNNPRKFSSSSKPEKEMEKILKEFGFNVKRTYKVNQYLCDIFVPEINLIIEYNGDYWHCNPNKYDKNYFHPHKKKLSSQIWREDEIRIDNITNYGYSLEIVWESEYKGKSTIQNIIQKYVKN